MSPWATTARRIAGVDLGKATVSFAIARIDPDGRFVVEETQVVAHDGRPFEAFSDWYERIDGATLVGLGATGLHGNQLAAPVLAGLPEEACLDAVLHDRGPLNVVRVGARGYSVWTRAADGSTQLVENERCSSGTGETMVKIASRFGLSITEADRLAAQASETIPITARCSVFAKSEMTHFANQGKPTDQLFRGYFDGVARHASALLARCRVPGPVWLVGGVSQLPTFVERFQAQIGAQVVVPADALVLEALGAVRLVAEQGASQALPADPLQLVRPRQAHFHALPPASSHSHRVTRLSAPEVPAGAHHQPSVLGIDLGSTGSKAVLSCLHSGQAVFDLYDRTRGNPVDAMQRLVRDLLQAGPLDVRAIGLTGSGREAAASVLRAAFPDCADRVVVINEIVAHATAAIRCDPDKGKSLSVVEIGGQDAKFIQIAGGRVVESDMNKACSAGTGSFLEEQAQFYGVEQIEDFTRLAAKAERVPDLGQMCTVFVADAASEALAEGYRREDIFAGFEHSVVHNYINRVRGQRTFGERIFFQGKPATSPTLARTVAAIAGREVMVPPNPGAMGAWGIGLCAIDSLPALQDAAPIELSRVLDAHIVSRKEFRCNDQRCANYCVVERTTVAVGDSRQKVLSGGACPKYELSSASLQKLEKSAPNAFAEHTALYADLECDGSQTVGVPLVGALTPILPWLSCFLRELGLGVRVLRSDPAALSRGETRCYAYDACAPVKVAHGIIDDQVDTVVFPKIIDREDPKGPGGQSCPVETAMPDMVQHSLRARGRHTRVLRPPLALARGTWDAGALSGLVALAQQLGVSAARVPRAAKRADDAQARFEQACLAIGRRSLDYAAVHGLPLVVVCGSLHTIHDRCIHVGIPDILRDNGVLAVPMDCYDLPDDVPAMKRVVWADANRAMRVAVAARRSGRVFPLWLSSFGCGPAAMSEGVFTALMDGYPHSVLESDGHGGKAGFVTRIQAFLHTVRAWDDGPSEPPPRRLALLAKRPTPPISSQRDHKLIPFALGDGFGPLLAAYYRALGYDAEAAPDNSAQVLASGRRDCSGKECLPYQLVWGGFRQRLAGHKAGQKTVLMEVTAAGACKNCMFSVKDDLSLERMGLSDDVSVRIAGVEPELGVQAGTRAFASFVAWDLLLQLAGWYRPQAAERVDQLYRQQREALLALAEQPEGSGPLGLVERRAWWRQLSAWIDTVSESFTQIAQQHPCPDLPAVLLAGDIYLRLDTFGNDGLVQRLTDTGLRVLVEPSHSFFEYLSLPRRPGMPHSPLHTLTHGPVRALMATVRQRLTGRVSAAHPQLRAASPSEIVEAASALIDNYPTGEAPLAVGSVLHHWAGGQIDGAVVIGPWGCGPTYVAESLLRHRRDIPQLFLYSDGSPLDPRKIEAFAFRLKRRRRSSVGEPRDGEVAAHHGVVR